MTTPDPGIAQVRLLTRLGAAELSDDDIVAYLAMNDGAVKLAAADALEGYAGTLTDVTSDDISLNGTRRAALLLQRAGTLRTQHQATLEDDDFFFDVVDNPAAFRPELTERGW